MPNRLPLVAVVTPVYNGAPWFERTAQCVQRQTYENLVYVVLDNASTDDTPDIIKANLNLKVPIITARNETVLSQSHNWNAAMKLVPDGVKYIMFLCADDLIRSDAIARFVAMAESDEDISIVTAGAVHGNEVLYPAPPKKRRLPVDSLIADGWDFIRSVCRRDYNHFAWQCIFARWLPTDSEGDYFPHDSASLDVDRGLQLLERGKLGIIYAPLLYTRLHENTVTSQINNAHNPKLRFTHWDICLKYAARAFPKAKGKARYWLQKQKWFVLRFQIYYKLVGAKESVDIVARKLKDNGHPIRLSDYLYALLDYLPHKLKKAKIAKQVSKGLLNSLTEDAFIKTTGKYGLSVIWLQATSSFVSLSSDMPILFAL